MFGQLKQRLENKTDLCGQKETNEGDMQETCKGHARDVQRARELKYCKFRNRREARENKQDRTYHGSPGRKNMTLLYHRWKTQGRPTRAGFGRQTKLD